jgi:hypothetical protein
MALQQWTVYSGFINVFRTHHQLSLSTDKDHPKINVSSGSIKRVKACSLVLIEVLDQ